MKAFYISIVLKIALYEMPSITFVECCNEEVKQCLNLGLTYWKNRKSICNWYKIYCDDNNTFNNPAKYANQNKLPAFLENNSEVATRINQFCKQNLNNLNGESFYLYLYETILPSLLIVRCKETMNNNMTIQDVLAENELVKLTVPIIYR